MQRVLIKHFYVYCNLFSLFLTPEKKLHQEKQLVEHTRQHFVEQAAHGYYKIQDDHIPFLNKG